MLRLEAAAVILPGIAVFTPSLPRLSAFVLCCWQFYGFFTGSSLFNFLFFFLTDNPNLPTFLRNFHLIFIKVSGCLLIDLCLLIFNLIWFHLFLSLLGKSCHTFVLCCFELSAFFWGVKGVEAPFCLAF